MIKKRSKIYTWPTRAICLFFVVIFVNACATKQHLEDERALKINDNLEQLQQWKLKGKIAWITSSERKSAYINWQQHNKNIQFDLTNLLGINLASLHYDGEIASLAANGEEYIDPSPSALIFRTTGWNVPIIPLSQWIKGATHTVNTKNTLDVNSRPLIERYENGLLKQLSSTCETCEQWIINYTSYEKVVIGGTEYQLPQQISMLNPKFNATIKIRVSQWSD